MLTALSDWRLEVALTGAAAIARSAALKPDCVLLDLHLPDMHGLDVLRQLRANPLTAALPCIALSADATQVALAGAQEAGCTDFIVKPFVFTDLMARLAAAVGAGAPVR